MQVIVYGVRGALKKQFVEALMAQFQAAGKAVAAYDFEGEASRMLADAKKACQDAPEKPILATLLSMDLATKADISGYESWRRSAPAQVHVVHGMLNPADFREVLYSQSNNTTICLRGALDGSELERVAVAQATSVMDCIREAGFRTGPRPVRSHFDIADDCAREDVILNAVVKACSR